VLALNRWPNSPKLPIKLFGCSSNLHNSVPKAASPVEFAMNAKYVLLVCLLLTSCSNVDAAIATGIAQTEQIRDLQTRAAGGGLPAATETPAADATDEELIFEPTGVGISVTAETNCRKGPSTAFAQVFTLKPGEEAEVVGKNTPTNYWIIISPSGENCWLWGRYAVISGDPSSLPEIASPPTPTSGATNPPSASATPTITFTPTPTFTASPTPPQPPAAPSNLTSDKACAGLANPPRWQETAVLYWKDNASDETSYRIYKMPQGGSWQLLATIGANSQAYPDQFIYSQGTGGPLYDAYRVEAWNNIGGSLAAYIDVYRCP
jgi:hypothetical protein